MVVLSFEFQLVTDQKAKLFFCLVLKFFQSFLEDGVELFLYMCGFGVYLFYVDRQSIREKIVKICIQLPKYTTTNPGFNTKYIGIISKWKPIEENPSLILQLNTIEKFLGTKFSFTHYREDIQTIIDSIPYFSYLNPLRALNQIFITDLMISTISNISITARHSKELFIELEKVLRSLIFRLVLPGSLAFFTIRKRKSILNFLFSSLGFEVKKDEEKINVSEKQ